jgi:hypothetical protein
MDQCVGCKYSEKQRDLLDFSLPDNVGYVQKDRLIPDKEVKSRCCTFPGASSPVVLPLCRFNGLPEHLLHLPGLHHQVVALALCRVPGLLPGGIAASRAAIPCLHVYRFITAR